MDTYGAFCITLASQLCKNHIATSIKDTCCFSKTRLLFQQNTPAVSAKHWVSRKSVGMGV